jgi:hypothetical protein
MTTSQCLTLLESAGVIETREQASSKSCKRESVPPIV